MSTDMRIIDSKEIFRVLKGGNEPKVVQYYMGPEIYQKILNVGDMKAELYNYVLQFKHVPNTEFIREIVIMGINKILDNYGMLDVRAVCKTGNKEILDSVTFVDTRFLNNGKDKEDAV